MRRIKLTVAYDGCNYSGWQIQPNASTIEQVLDNAINKVTGEKVHVIGASRTDAGVHGLGNVAVFGFCDQHARQIVVVAIAARTGQLQIRVHTGQPLPHVFIAFFSHIICPLWWSRGRIP